MFCCRLFSSSDKRERDMLSVIDPATVKMHNFKGCRFNARPCEIYDGDTFSSIFVYNNIITKLRCRCLGYDSPEMKPSLQLPNRREEITAAKIARDRFANMLNEHKTIVIECGNFDKYGRLLVTIYPPKSTPSTMSINQRMVIEGHGVPYYGGKKPLYSVPELHGSTTRNTIPFSNVGVVGVGNVAGFSAI